ncbi:MAG: BolA/IbaG family iron-sulfur metabolism protein [Bacteriovoracales bacterium]
MDFEKIKKLIMDKIPDAEVEVTDLTGTRDHLGISVTSKEFKGKPLLAQHRMIMNILKEGLKTEIHAVEIKTQTK